MAINSNSKRSPNIFVISAPSGTGKTTLVERLIKEMGDKLILGISTTSRPKRLIEISDEHYSFITEEEFKRKVDEDYFLEWAIVHGNNYGTPRVDMNRLLESGKAPIWALDCQGLCSVRENMDKTKYNRIIDIFILPPSRDEVIRRLNARGTTDEEEISRRLNTMEKEMVISKDYTYKIVNDDFDRAYGELKGIIEKSL